MTNNGYNNGNGNGHPDSIGDLILTIGHSTKTLKDFIQILKRNGVTKLIDVRAIPRSRSNPPFNSESLPAVLGAEGIGYLHMGGLGGLRCSKRGATNDGWLDLASWSFADYMRSPEFEENLAALIELAELGQVALMCAEAVPWQCHRAMIADALTVRGIRVEHIINTGPRRVHVLTPWATINGTRIIYPLQVPTGGRRQVTPPAGAPSDRLPVSASELPQIGNTAKTPAGALSNPLPVHPSEHRPLVLV